MASYASPARTTKPRRSGAGGSGSGGGKKKKKKTSQHAFRSITVLQNDGRGNSTTKTMDDNATLFANDRGVHAGPNWSIRHRDFDCDYLLGQVEDEESIDGTNDFDSSEGVLAVRTRDGTRLFECRIFHPSELDDHLQQDDDNPRVRGQFESRMRQLQSFAADVVRIHERWRGKHSDAAAKIDGAGGGRRSRNRTASGRSGSGSSGAGGQKIGSMGRTTTTTTTTMGTGGASRQTAFHKSKAAVRSVTPTPNLQRRQQIHLSSPTRRSRTYGSRGAGGGAAAAAAGRGGRGGGGLDRYLPSSSPSPQRHFSPKAPRNATPTKIRSLRNDDDDDDDDDHDEGGLLQLDDAEDVGEEEEEEEPSQRIRAGKKLFPEPTNAAAAVKASDGGGKARSGGEKKKNGTKIGRRLMRGASRIDRDEEDSDGDSDLDFGGAAVPDDVANDDDDDDHDHEEEAELLERGQQPKEKQSQQKKRQDRVQVQVHDDDDASPEKETKSSSNKDKAADDDEEGGDDDVPSPPQATSASKTAATFLLREEESNLSVAVTDEEEIAETPTPPLNKGAKGSSSSTSAKDGKDRKVDKDKQKDASTSSGSQNIMSFFAKATTGSTANKKKKGGTKTTTAVSASASTGTAAKVTSVAGTASAATGQGAAVKEETEKDEDEDEEAVNDTVDDTTKKIGSTWGSSLSPARPSPNKSSKDEDDGEDGGGAPAQAAAASSTTKKAFKSKSLFSPNDNDEEEDSEDTPLPSDKTSTTRELDDNDAVERHETASSHFFTKRRKPLGPRFKNSANRKLGATSRLHQRNRHGRSETTAEGGGYKSESDEEKYERSDSPVASASRHHRHQLTPSLSGTPTRRPKRAAGMECEYDRVARARTPKRMRESTWCYSPVTATAPATSSADLALGRSSGAFCSGKTSRRLDLPMVNNPYTDKSGVKRKWTANNGRWGIGNGGGPNKFKDNVAVGLRNMGNTCYLNSSLQMLFSVPGFASDLKSTYEAIKSKQTENSTKDGTKDGTNEKEGDKDNKPPQTMPLATSLLNVATSLNLLPQASESSTSSEGEGKASAAAASDDKSLPPQDQQQPTKNARMVANPKSVKAAMDALTDKFVGFEQRDAHEFLSDLIDMLHDELAAASKSSSLSSSAPTNSEEKAEKDKATADDKGEADESKEDTKEEEGESNGLLLPTDKYFRLDVKVCLTCDSCGYARSKEELYRHLSLDVGDDESAWSIERGLEQFFGPEKREVKCEKCSEGETATQEMEIIKRPKALLLHLKRFILTQKSQDAMTNTSDKENNEKVPKVDEKDNDDSSLPPLEPSSGDDKTSKAAAVEIVFRKNKARVVVHETTSLDSFCATGTNSAENGIKKTYNALSVVHHIGGTAISGHYTTDALRTRATGLVSKDGTSNASEAQWVDFDDSVTANTTPAKVLNEERSQRNVYMTLYFA